MTIDEKLSMLRKRAQGVFDTYIEKDMITGDQVNSLLLAMQVLNYLDTMGDQD